MDIFSSLLVSSGGGLVLADLYRWNAGWLYIFRLGIAAFGGFSAQAYILKIRPFEDPPYPPKWAANEKAETIKTIGSVVNGLLDAAKGKPGSALSAAEKRLTSI